MLCCFAFVNMCLPEILCSIYMPALAAGEQKKSSLQVQMREMCLFSLPQGQEPAFTCSSPVQGTGSGVWVGQVGCYFVLKNISSSWSGGEFATLFKDAHWDFHKVQGFLVLRGSNAFFSHPVIFFQCPIPNSSWRSSSKDESMTTICVQLCAPWGEMQTASCRPAQIAEPGHVSDPMKV